MDDWVTRIVVGNELVRLPIDRRVTSTADHPISEEARRIIQAVLVEQLRRARAERDR
jgi:hypothetical protein